jgi:PAS domain-containing protein
MRHENGDWVWVWQRGLAVRDVHGRVTKTVGALLDVTRRKRTESALRESEARFRHMADSVPALIWMTDHDGQVIFATCTSTSCSLVRPPRCWALDAELAAPG